MCQVFVFVDNIQLYHTQINIELDISDTVI